MSILSAELTIGPQLVEQNQSILTSKESLQIAGKLLNLLDAAPDKLKAGIDISALQQQFDAAIAAQIQTGLSND